MKKQLIGMVAGIAAAVMMTGTAFAGEFVNTSSDHTKFLDFIDANNFRIIDSNQGTETYFGR